MPAATYIGTPCKRAGHTERYVSMKGCVACIREDQRAWHRANPEKTKKYNADHWAKDPIGRTEKATEYRRAHPEKDAEYCRRWRKKNPHKVVARVVRRKAAELQRTPSWADHEWIEHAYFVAADMTAKMGEPFHVDHIIPLRGKTVSGLHVYENLQILPAKDNIRKSNHFEGAA